MNLFMEDKQEELKKHKFIIFGSYSANTLGQIRGLGEKGIKPVVVLMHKNTFRVDKSRYIFHLFNVKDVDRGLDLIIEKYGNEQYKPFLYTDCDNVVEAFDRRYNELVDRFFFWNAGGQGMLHQYFNKNEQIELAKKCGFRVPNTEVVKVGDLPQSLSYPIFTKSVDSLDQYWKGNAYICHTEQELREAYDKMDVNEILLQEYILKKNEIPIEGISLNGGSEVKLFVKSVNYRFTKDSYGIYRHLEPFKDIELERLVRQYIREINYTGVFEIEFLIGPNEELFFLETNYRITQYNFGYTKFGVNFPYLYAMSILNGSIDEQDVKYSPNMPFNVMSEFEDFRISVLHGQLSFFRWIKDVYETDCFSFYDSKDKSPFYYTLISKFVNLISKKIKHKL